MSTESKLELINRQLVSDMLFGEERYIREFATASIESFEQFLEEYSNYLVSRDMDNLRKAGHKIKPVALMLKVDNLVDEYEHAKRLLEERKPDSELHRSIERVSSICRTVICDFKLILKT